MVTADGRFTAGTAEAVGLVWGYAFGRMLLLDQVELWIYAWLDRRQARNIAP